MRTPIVRIGLASAAAAAGLALSACATEEYVDTHIAAVNAKIDGVNAKADANSGKIDALGARVDGVDKTAQDALQRANAAAQLASTKADAKFLYTDTSQGVSVQFATAKTSLSPEAEATLMGFADKLKSANKDVYIEIVGHADPRGSARSNQALSRERAARVYRFLADQGVPLSRMDVAAWGETKSANPKDRSPEALQQARRVDLVVRG